MTNTRRKLPAKRDPRMQQKKGLSFDNFKNEELIPLSRDEKGEAFMSRYLEEHHPFTKFKKYFDNSAYESSRILLEIKRKYLALVVDKSVWSEERFVGVTNMILASDLTIGDFAYDTMSRRYSDTSGSTTKSKAVRKRL